MGSISISVLENKRATYEKKLSSARKRLQSSETAYNTLVEFKGKIQNSLESFHSISTREVELLSNIQPYYDYNKCAKIFIDTFSNFLDGIGTKVVKLAYSALIRMTSAQLSSTFSEIEEINDEILNYSNVIEDINEEIAYQSSMGV